MAGRLDALDDPDYPAYTTGRAAEVLGVRQRSCAPWTSVP
jgi:hypothetical protein